VRKAPIASFRRLRLDLIRNHCGMGGMAGGMMPATVKQLNSSEFA
jgi:hypothetical protein